MKNPLKMDDLGVPLFLETPIYENHLPNYMDFPGIWPDILFFGEGGGYGIFHGNISSMENIYLLWIGALGDM